MNVFIIAELGNTHEGSLGLAKQFVKVASECGVDAVKFQTHIFDAESLPDAPNPPYFDKETRKDYFDRTAFNLEQWAELKSFAEEECCIEFISSPFSIEAVELLEKIDLKNYKIPSGEVTNIPLLKKIAQTHKRVFLSSGMSSWDEIDRAINVLEVEGCKELILFQCTSEYPCPPQESGLNVLNEMKQRYGLPIGLSDHTFGCSMAIAAVVFGAEYIEKHFTLSKKMYGTDAKNSTEPDEFKNLVNELRNLELGLNNKIDKDQKANELKDMKIIFEKSIVTSKPLKKEEIITEDDLAYKKPGDGIPASEFDNIVGKKIKKSVSKDYKINWNDIY